MDIAEVGSVIRQARKQQGITQKELADACGLSRATINALESGKVQELGFMRIHALNAYLGLKLSCLPVSAPARFKFDSTLLNILQKRYVWWSLPGIEPDEWRVIAQVMNIGTFSDTKAMEAEIGTVIMQQVLSEAQPGWFSPKSWAYWHIALNLSDFDGIPPLPRRKNDLQTGLQDLADTSAPDMAASWHS